MKVRFNLKGKSNGISWVVAYDPTDDHKAVRDEDRSWATLGSTVAEAPNGEHLPVLMNAKARTGERGEGRVDDKMLGTFE